MRVLRKVSVLLTLVSFTESQILNPEAKSRFDKILADFGFSDTNINTLSLEGIQNDLARSPPLNQFRGANQNFGVAPASAPSETIQQAKPKADNPGGSPLNNLINIASGRNKKKRVRVKKIRNGPPSFPIQQQSILQQSRSSAPKLRVVTNRNRNPIKSERRNKLSGAREPSFSALPSPALPVLSPGQFQEAANTQTGAAAGTGPPPLTEPVINTQTRSRSQHQQQQITTAAKQQPRNFNFEQTLKDFGFNPQLLSSSPIINDKPKENIVTKNQQLQPVQSFPSARPVLDQGFTGRITEEKQSADVSPQHSQAFLQSQNRAAAGAPSFSRGQSRGRGTGSRSPGLSSLLAIAGDPQKNPVASISELNSDASPSTLPRNFVVRNRARTVTRTQEKQASQQEKTPTPLRQTNSVLEDETSKSLQQINPFVNPAIPTQGLVKSTTMKPLRLEVSDSPKIVLSSEIARPREDTRRTSLPRPTNTRKAEIKKTEPPVESTKKNKKFSNQNPKKGSTQKQQEPDINEDLGFKSPGSVGCLRVCSTLILEVYQLLGGNLCDCQ